MQKSKSALLYIRNGKEMIFPVKDIEHAVRIADAIADSDLLNDDVDYNMFEVFRYSNGKLGDEWENDVGLTFNDYWNMRRNNE